MAETTTLLEEAVHRNRLSVIALLTTITTFVWLALLIWDMAAHGPVETLDQAIARAGDQDVLYNLTYANVVLLTLLATALFAGLRARYESDLPLWSAIAAAVLPVYAALNLFSYLSQITIVPRLLEVGRESGQVPMTEVLAGFLTQAWPGSAVAILNALAYALLGIPSVIYGVAMAGEGAALRIAGWLLALSGMASAIGLIGVITGTPLSLGSGAGGVIFALALVAMSVGLLGEKRSEMRGRAAASETRRSAPQG